MAHLRWMSTSSLIDLHLRKLHTRDTISEEEESAIRGLVNEVTEIGRDRTVVRHGQEIGQSILLIEGWMMRAKDLPGGQRQIVEINVPGDFVDLHGFTLKRLDHDLVTVTKCRLAMVPHERLKEITERFPHLTRVYWFNTNLDAAIHREWTLSLGRRSAIARLAHIFCELNIRLGIVGLTSGNSYAFPLTQIELGECLGLTSVHINRTLQELRRMQLVELQNRRVRILDLAKLKSIAAFDDDYLYLGKKQR